MRGAATALQILLSRDTRIIVVVRLNMALDAEFQKILNDFRLQVDLTPSDLKDFQLTSLESLRVAMDKIQKRQASTRTMQYMKRVDPFLQSMEQYGKVVEVFVNTSDILAFVWVSEDLIVLTMFRTKITPRDQ
jgi:hypothetical protein